MSTIIKEFTKEQLQQIIETDHVQCGEASALARIALASLEAEPVCVIDQSNLDYLKSGSDADVWPASRTEMGDVLLYRAAPPAPVAVPECFKRLLHHAYGMTMGHDWNKGTMAGHHRAKLCQAVDECRAAMLQGSQPVSKREQVRREHAEWSDKTFGDVGPVGPLKHLSKEALEAAAEPDDLSEWADMQFLLWDAQRRAGISDGEITAAMEEKLKVNMARQWPEPKDGEPRQHLKPAPQTVPDSVISAAVNGIMATYADNAEDCREMVRTHVEQACRAAIQESGHG